MKKGSALSNRSNQTEAPAKAPERPRRILHIGKYFPPHRGGMETVLRDQMNMQSRDEGLQVAAVVHSSERRVTDRVEVQPLGYRVRHAARWFTAIFAPIAPLFAWSVYREICELDPDEIKIHMPNLSAFWLLFLPAARKRRWVVLWHSDVLPSKHNLGLWMFYRFYKPFETWLLKRADVVIATSPPYLETSEPLKPYRKKCLVKPLILDKLRLPAPTLISEKASDKEKRALRILCVGRLTYYKNIKVLVDAVCRLKNTELRIIGDGPEGFTLRSQVTKNNVQDRIIFLGEVDEGELWKQFAWCDFNVLPSAERTEAFGITILEAAHFNKATLHAAVPGSGLSYVSESTGFPGKTFTPGCVGSLCNAIIASATEIQNVYVLHDHKKIKK